MDISELNWVEEYSNLSRAFTSRMKRIGDRYVYPGGGKGENSVGISDKTISKKDAEAICKYFKKLNDEKLIDLN